MGGRRTKVRSSLLGEHPAGRLRSRRQAATLGNGTGTSLDSGHGRCRTLEDMTEAEKQALERQYNAKILPPRPPEMASEQPGVGYSDEGSPTDGRQEVKDCG